MQQMQALRQRLSEGSRWFQLGLASATLMTPLMKRWSDLQAAERARALRLEAEARLRDMRVRSPWGRGGEALEPAGVLAERLSAGRKGSSRLWLVGVGVGLVAAGTAAYVLVRRRMEQSLEEPVLDVPVMGTNGTGAHLRAAEERMAQEQSAATLAERPAARPPQSPPAAPPVAERAESRQQTALAECSGTGAGEAAPAGAPTAEAPFIGNIRTLVYHKADDENLPAEENRIYFASEDEAREAGYRRDRADMPPDGVEPAAGTELEMLNRESHAPEV
jgi:hypothetical protein